MAAEGSSMAAEGSSMAAEGSSMAGQWCEGSFSPSAPRLVCRTLGEAGRSPTSPGWWQPRGPAALTGSKLRPQRRAALRGSTPDASAGDGARATRTGTQMGRGVLLDVSSESRVYATRSGGPRCGPMPTRLRFEGVAVRGAALEPPTLHPLLEQQLQQWRLDGSAQRHLPLL